MIARRLANTKRNYRITFPPDGLPHWTMPARVQLFDPQDVGRFAELDERVADVVVQLGDLRSDILSASASNKAASAAAAGVVSAGDNTSSGGGGGGGRRRSS